MTEEEVERMEAILENNMLRRNAFGHTTELTYQAGGHYIHSFGQLWFMPADLTTGVEYTGSHLEDASGYRELGISQLSRSAGTFLQNEWKSDRWSILLGGRIDKHNLVEKAIVSPVSTCVTTRHKTSTCGSPTAAVSAPHNFSTKIFMWISRGATR